MYRLAEDAGALIVISSNSQCIQLATTKPCEHMGYLARGVVGTGPAFLFRVYKVAHTAFWTRVPGDCDIIIVASCHSSHTGWWADGWGQVTVFF